jgi:type IV pilus assembly protein PilN
MIRINLLPQRREARQEASQTWLAVLMGVLFVEAVALFFLHQHKTNELGRHKRANQELQQQINEIQKTVANHAQVKAQLTEFKNREEAIRKLQGARSGPTNVLLEVARVLSVGRGPTVDPDRLAQLRRDNPLAVPNQAWDTRRLWLTTYKEVERTVTIEGLARDGEDVSELARRLSLSNYFQDVKILPASKVTDTLPGAPGAPAVKIEMLKFQMQAKVKY